MAKCLFLSGIEKNKGIGPYTAAAISSIAFQEVIPLLMEIQRVFSRFLGINTQSILLLVVF
jgi:adenine-specific DNA glycosylase